MSAALNGAEPPAKRARTEEAGSAPPLTADDATAALRKAIAEVFPEYAADSNKSVNIHFVSGGSDVFWRPLFTYQIFPEELMLGYKSPALNIYYTDPDLRIRVAFSADGSMPPGSSIPVGLLGDQVKEALQRSLGFLARMPVAPDGLHRLKPALPDGFPLAAVELHIKGAPADSEADGSSASASAGGAASSSSSSSAAAVTSSRQSHDHYWPEPDAATAASAAAAAAWSPPGRLVTTWPVPASHAAAVGAEYVIYRWNAEEAREDAASAATATATATAAATAADPHAAFVAYWSRISTLAVWLIEAATPIDITDSKWTVYLLYQRHPSSGTHRFVGYTTMYKFVNPLRAQSTAVRLCQLLITPPYQRRGLGERLLSTIHDAAAASDAWEVTVESPCEGMTKLRDAFDIKRCYEQRLFQALPGWETFGPALPGTDSSGGAAASALAAAAAVPIQPLPEAALQPVRTALRITTHQVIRCYEALLLSRIQRYATAAASSAAATPATATAATATDGAPAAPAAAHAETETEQYRAFRLMVKKRILAGDADIRALGNAEDRKTVLEDRYREACACYLPALARLGLVPRAEAAAAEAVWEARKEAIEAENTA